MKGFRGCRKLSILIFILSILRSLQFIHFENYRNEWKIYFGSYISSTSRDERPT
jgi:hypothetical protein